MFYRPSFLQSDSDEPTHHPDEQWGLQFSAMVFTLSLPKQEEEGIYLSQGETHSPTPQC